MRIRLIGMQGMWPRRESRLLEDRQAQTARDTRLFSGAIRAYREPSVVESDVSLPGVGTQDIWRWRVGDEDYWFRFPSPVEAIRGPVAGDVWERVYWTGDSRFDGPRYTYSPAAITGGDHPPVNSYRLGVPAPESVIAASKVAPLTMTITQIDLQRPIRVVVSAPHGLQSGQLVEFDITSSGLGDNSLEDFLNSEESFQITVTGDEQFTLDFSDGESVSYDSFDSGTATAFYDPARSEARFYVHTYVTDLGEEGAPSEPSLRLDVDPFQSATLTIPEIDPGAGDGRVIDKRRIYRTATGTQGAQFLFLTELSIGETAFTDDIGAEALAEPLPSTNWSQPPEALRGLDTLPTGIVIGFFDQEVCFSEPYRPHAWPVGYRLTLDEPIVALGIFDASVVAATRGRPYLITGNDPRSMQPQRLDVTQGCVSARSMVSLGYAVVYASPEGLVQVSRSGATIVTAGYMTADEWSAYAPESIHAYEYEGRYIGFYERGDGDKGGFIFDPREPELGFQELDFWAVAGYRDATSRSLFLLDENADIVQWDAGEVLRPYRWRSKRFQFPYDINVSAAYIVADSYDDLTFRLYAGGALQFSTAVTSDRTFRLPAGYRARDCEVEVEGTDTVQEIVFGEHAEELTA